MASTSGRRVIVPLVNRSGGQVVAGDVVVIGDGTNDACFTTTTTASFNARHIGIAQETIASLATGRVMTSGYASVVNSATSLTRDHFLFTSTTAKEATGSATRAAGAFGQVLTTGTDTVCLIWGVPDATAGGGGAPTDAQYVTGASHASLSAELEIPKFLSDIDVPGTLGGSFAEEFGDTTTGLTWDPSAPTTDEHTTVLHHLYATWADATARYGYQTWAPTGAFEAIAKLTVGADGDVASGGLFITDSAAIGSATGALVLFEVDITGATMQVKAFTDASGTFTQRGSTWAVGMRDYMYVKITRDASNNLGLYFSANGRSGSWVRIASQALTFTVAKIGVRLAATSTGTHYFICDYIRGKV